MCDEQNNANTNLEALTRTLLYEGYALYPYHRSAIKNQKPIPFGVVFPQAVNACDKYANSQMQSECVLIGSKETRLTIIIRFLHLKQIELFEIERLGRGAEEQIIPIDHAMICNKYYQAGWQTVERKISTGEFLLSNLLSEQQAISFSFPKEFICEDLPGEKGKNRFRQTASLSAITGKVTVNAVPVSRQPTIFKLSININNTTPIEQADSKTRDELHRQSFLSTHIVFEATNGCFISHINPEPEWKTLIAECKQENLWPVLIDENNSTLLASPIILYDHPKINTQSNGDLFDSTEIEEALLLHVSVLSNQEKKRIAQTDDKLSAMLNKINNITAEEMESFHSHLRHSNEIAKK